jgi:ketosteroid isomerase-like protein
MSEENVEIVGRSIEAINRRGLQAALEVVDEFCDPDAELRAVGRLPDLGRLLRGREAIKGYWAQFFGTFDNYHLDADEFIDAGDAVVVVARMTARGRGSGAEVSNPIVLMYGLRDGKITYLDAYRTKSEALEAAGLRE